jgi:hypothetical protein
VLVLEQELELNHHLHPNQLMQQQQLQQQQLLLDLIL